jgi:hypothetical protein
VLSGAPADASNVSLLAGQATSRSDSRRLGRGSIVLTRRHAGGLNRGMPMGFETHSRQASVSIEPTRWASKAAIFASCCSM